MRFIIGLILILSFCQISYGGVSEDVRISDNDGDVISITSGQFTINQTNSTGTPLDGQAEDVRISDNSGDVLSITSQGALNVAWA